MSLSQRREHLIDTAISLFAERGYHATGIDTILAQSGVSKKTLYRHFRSKDELILAALKKYDGLFRNDFMRRVEERADSPDKRLLAVFDVAADWFEDNDFFGCLYISATSEFSESGTPIRQACMDFKAQMRRYIEELCSSLPAQDPQALAEEIALLLEGAIVTAQVSGTGRRAAQVARGLAEMLIAQAAKP